MRKLLRKLRDAVFGRPLTHEEAAAQRDAEAAVRRAAGDAAHRARSHSVQSQTYWM
ncbi:hypothetical protein [Microbacterium sp.]|uniref:hypothetical protein n=1 Tax=Microbacterium sp. TaxID=51671 RepID=UPI0037C61E45